VVVLIRPKLSSPLTLFKVISPVVNCVQLCVVSGISRELVLLVNDSVNKCAVSDTWDQSVNNNAVAVWQYIKWNWILMDQSEQRVWLAAGTCGQ
jgi:hypothetical protein